MPYDKPVKAIGLNWHKPIIEDEIENNEYDEFPEPSGIGACQIIFSNGKKSPLFLAEGGSAGFLKTADLDLRIKRIRGSYFQNNNYIAKIHFLDANQKLIGQIITTNHNQGIQGPITIEQVLGDDEVLIGVYGSKK